MWSTPGHYIHLVSVCSTLVWKYIGVASITARSMLSPEAYIRVLYCTRGDDHQVAAILWVDVARPPPPCLIYLPVLIHLPASLAHHIVCVCVCVHESLLTYGFWFRWLPIETEHTHTPPHSSFSFSEAGGSILSPSSSSPQSSSPSSWCPDGSPVWPPHLELINSGSGDCLAPCLCRDVKRHQRCHWWGCGGFPWLPGCLLCGRGREFPWLCLKSSLCLLCLALHAPSSIQCQRCQVWWGSLYCSAEKAQGQHNTIPPVLCVCHFDWEADQFALPDWIFKAQAANVAAWKLKAALWLKEGCRIRIYFQTILTTKNDLLIMADTDQMTHHFPLLYFKQKLITCSVCTVRVRTAKIVIKRWIIQSSITLIKCNWHHYSFQTNQRTVLPVFSLGHLLLCWFLDTLQWQ